MSFIEIEIDNGTYKTIKWIEIKDQVMDIASKKGDINSLEKNLKLLKKNLDSDEKYSTNALFYASHKGHINVLDWWLNSGLKLKYDCRAMDIASQNLNTKVLNWWLNSGLKLKYSKKSFHMNCAVTDTKKTIKTLNWWLKSKLFLKYEDGMNYAIEELNIPILKWWINSGLELKYDNNIDYINVKNKNCINVIKLFIQHDLPMSYSETFLDKVSIEGNIKLLKWWFKSGLEIKYSRIAMDESQFIKILQCWLDSGLELKYTNIAFEFAESPEVLQWWFDSGLKIIYEDLDEYLHNEDIDMLNVWSKSGLPLIFSKNTSPIQSEEIIQWCIENKVSKKVYRKKK